MPRLPLSRTWVFGLLALCLPLLIAAAVHALSRAPGQAHEASVLRLQQGTRQVDAGLVPPPLPAAAGASAALPLRVAAGQRGATWVQLPFTLDQPASEAWTLSIAFQPTLLVYLDGQLLAQSVHPDRADQASADFQLGSQSLTANVPAGWLGAGAHSLQLRLGPPGPSGGVLGTVHLGPPEAMQRLARAQDGWTALRGATTLAALVVGLLLVLTWLANRDSRVYLLAGTHVLLLGLLLSPYVLDGQPLPSPWWRVLLDVADVLAKALLLATVAVLARPAARGPLRAAAAYALVGVAIDGLAAWHGLAWNDFSHPWPWWALGSRALVLGAAAALAWREVLRRPDLERLVTATLVAVSAWLWAYVSLFALVLPGRLGVVDVNVVAHAGWVLWVGMLLQRHFIQATRRERQLRQEAADALAQRTHELQASFAALQASERERLAAAERTRLLQEMHDGLGSQLMAAKMGAQAGHLSAAEMVSTLEACIQEMRLSVDALSVVDGDLGLLLANVRHRLQRGLVAAGLALDWQVADTPLVPALAGAGGRELVRIVQECFNNVMHHAQATRLTVNTVVDADGRGVTVVIADNGRGMPADAAPGRGTHNIRQRVQRLGGRVAWLSPAVDGVAGGTRLTVWLPLTDASDSG